MWLHCKAKIGIVVPFDIVLMTTAAAEEGEHWGQGRAIERRARPLHNSVTTEVVHEQLISQLSQREAGRGEESGTGNRGAY